MKKFNLYSAALAVAGIFITSGTVYSGNGAPPQLSVPTLGEWGMIGTAIVLGIAGIYKIFRNK
jgi:hypothetical protein